ncbi:MAG TPA: sulfite exporter TauE/SafE family protein [Crocinitomicaceae bacterium]|nr:sulfite exporter TauE/SafE family protein [Crocinitomicaceae bacterium]
MIAVYVNGLVLGLGASFHCLGMCGPLVMAVPMKRTNNLTYAFDITQYHLGKMFSYAVLGFLVGLIGLSFQTFKSLQILSIISGVFIVIFAWGKFIKIPFGKGISQKFLHFSSGAMRFLVKSEIPFKPFFFGIINGLLPCGLVYLALINSLVVGSPFQSALAMVFFGLGTVPVLTVARLVAGKFQWKTNRLTPILITLVGVMIIFRGLNLNIPYLSPKLDTKIVSSQDGQQKEEVEMSCCTAKKCD